MRPDHARAQPVTDHTEPVVHAGLTTQRAAWPVERAASADGAEGFRRALLLEHDALRAALAAAPRPARERLTALAAELYDLLRTPIFPKGSYKAVAETLVHATGGTSRLHLHGVLASPTAALELPAFLRCAGLFEHYGCAPRLTLWLVRWENLVETRDQDAAARARAFAWQVQRVSEAARQAGYAEAVTPIDVEVDTSVGEIIYPLDFSRWSRRIAVALQEPRAADPALGRDLAWSRDFYARQASLSRLGQEQVLLDLAIRRAVGQRVSEQCGADGDERADGTVLLLTSELHKRFLPCYGASTPILNIDLRRCAAEATSAAKTA